MTAIRPAPSTERTSDAMDVLSEVLAICRSEHAVTARFALSAPWGLSSAGVPGAMIRLARRAPYWLEIDGLAPMRIEPGDLVMMRPGVPHRMVSAPGAGTTAFSEMIARHARGARDENPLVFEHGGGGEMTEMFSAQIWFSAYCRHVVLEDQRVLVTGTARVASDHVGERRGAGAGRADQAMRHAGPHHDEIAGLDAHGRHAFDLQPIGGAPREPDHRARHAVRGQAPRLAERETRRHRMLGPADGQHLAQDIHGVGFVLL